MDARSQDPLWRVLTALAIFAAALAVRSVYLVQIEAYPKFEYIRNRLDDQVVFDYWAKSIARGETPDFSTTGHEFAHWAAANEGVYPQAPLYPWFLAGLYQTLGFRYDAVRLVQMLLGSLAAALVYLIGLRYLRSGFAFLAGLGAAFYGPFVFYEATFLRAGLTTFVTALSLYSLLRASEAGSRRAVGLWSPVAGLSLATAVLLRPNFLVFALPAVAWLYLARTPRYRNAAPRLAAGLVLTGLLVPVLAVAATNTVRSGRLAFVSSNGPYIFFIGNVHDAPGNTAGVSPFYREIKASDPPRSVDLLGEALRDIRAHPMDWGRLELRKLGYLFTPEEQPNNLSYPMAKKTNPALELAFLELWMILPLALLGLLASFRSRRDFSLLYVFGTCYAVATILFYVLSRLRQPIVIPMLVFAALAVQVWWGSLRRRCYLRAAAGALLVIAATIHLAPEPERHRDADYQMAGAAYFSRALELEDAANLDEAYRHYVRAVVLNPDHGGALRRALLLRAPAATSGAEIESLARAVPELVERGELEEARRRLERIASQAPGSHVPQHYLANVYYLAGDPLRALEHLEKAVELAPQDPLLRENLKALRRELAARTL